MIKLEKDENSIKLQKIKFRLNELLESKAMLMEEISGKLIERADYLSLIEIYTMKQLSYRNNQLQMKEISFYFEEDDLKQKIKGYEEELEVSNRNEENLMEEIKELELKIQNNIEKIKFLKIELDFKKKDKTKKFGIFVKAKLDFEEKIQNQLDFIGAMDYFDSILKPSKSLFEKLDDLDKFNEEQIMQLFTQGTEIADLDSYYTSNDIDPIIKSHIKEILQNYNKILMDYAIYRNYIYLYHHYIFFHM